MCVTTGGSSARLEVAIGGVAPVGVHVWQVLFLALQQLQVLTCRLRVGGVAPVGGHVWQVLFFDTTTL